MIVCFCQRVVSRHSVFKSRHFILQSAIEPVPSPIVRSITRRCFMDSSLVRTLRRGLNVSP
jgi:hypothetical protein